MSMRKKGLKKMRNSWQLCVVDWDRALKSLEEANDKYFSSAEFKNYRQSVVDHAKNPSLKDGTVCYFISADSATICGWNTMIAQIYIPSTGHYGHIAINALHPVLLESDVIELSLKFGIDFKAYGL